MATLRSCVRLVVAEVLERLERDLKRAYLRLLRRKRNLSDGSFELLELEGELLKRAVDRLIARGDHLG
jgi:hypothetical protein